MNTVLMVAFHYPPYFGSSGVQRTLKFSRYLPDSGWKPLVLTAQSRAYPQSTPEQLAEIPPAVRVIRAFALDTSRHFAVRGSSLRLMSLPDRWSTWVLGAIPAGLSLIRRERPAVIWSTYPIATAHLIGLALHRFSGLPWVADFRDSMTEDGYPRDRLTRKSYLALERQVVRRASRIVFTARSTRAMYLARYPRLDPDRCVVISNGYDEVDFASFGDGHTARPSSRPLRLVHAGLIYPEERDPRPFFRALSRLKREGQIDQSAVSIELRASGSEEAYATMLVELGISDLVHLLPAVPYHKVLRECSEADALLLLQGPSCNHQIPAKLYEYLRLRKPILALTDARGDTAQILAETGGATVLDLLQEDAIHRGLPSFLESLRLGTHALPDRLATARHARHIQAQTLGECLDMLATAGTRSRRSVSG